jgi:hypothetical protein
MTIKIVSLKSGEDVICDIKEMVSPEEKFIGYFLVKPYVTKIFYDPVSDAMEKNQLDGENDDADDVITAKRQSTQFSIKLYPWMPLSKDSTIPIPLDWVVTMVDPVDRIKELYSEQLDFEKDANERLREGNVGNEDDQSDSVSEQ